MSESPTTPAAQESPPAGLLRRRWLPIAAIVGGTLLLLTALALIILLGLRSVFFKDEATPSMPLEVVKLTPTTTTTIPITPTSTLVCETTISSGDVQIAVPLPISLTVSGESFPVKAIILPTSPFPPSQGEEAAWVCGTVVNYVVGLVPLPANETLLADLRPGDEIKMLLSDGVGLIFRFVEWREVAAHDASVFEQFRPRLTLVLEREDGTWQIATADYTAETEPVQPPSGTLAQLGQAVHVGDAQVTAIRGHAKRSGPDLQPGTMYYLVEFSVENVGAAPLDTNTFTTQLQDGVGNWYLLSSAASAAGEYGPFSGEIGPSATAQGTAGYLVPGTLAGPTLLWTFSPTPGSGLRASVSIPYEAETETETPAHAEVTIAGVFLSSDGNVLMIEGEVRNTGGAALTVEVGDVSLSSSAGISELRMAAPPLPWTIQPGQTQVIELQYARPAASAALLSLLGYSFEIQGL